MSLEQNPENRKALARRVKAMIKAAKVLGYSVWEIATYDEDDKEKRAEVATLLAENLRNPGSLGAFIAQAQILNDSGKRQSIVREGGIQTALCLWSEQCANVMEGWAWTDMAAAFGVAPTDKRLDDKARGMSEAIRKLGFVAERYQGYFKVMTVTEVAIKDEYMRRNIEGQIKSRARKSKPLRVRGHEPSGSQNLQMAWWDLPQLEANERGRARD